MKLTVSKTSPTEIVLNIAAEATDLSGVLRSVYKELRPQVKAAGFRPGKAPDNIVERELGSKHVQEHFVEHATRRLYAEALSQEKLQPVGAPHVEVKKFVPYGELELELKLEVMPEVKLPDYKSIKKSKTEVKVETADIDKVIESLRARAAERTEVKRAAQSGDEIVIDMVGYRQEAETKKRVEVPGTKAEDYEVLLGSSRFVPGFEEQLVGLKAGEEKKFKITFPKDYGEPTLQNKEVEFEVKAKTVKEVKLPTVDDKFATTVGPFKSLAELKTDIKKQLEIEKEQDSRRKLTDELVDEIVAKTQLDLPAGLVARQKEHLLQEFIGNLQSQGIDQNKYLKPGADGKQPDVEKMMEDDAKKRVKTALVLSQIAKAEELSVSPEELEIRMQILKGRYTDKAAQDELAKPEVRRDVGDQLLIEKTVQKLVDYSTT